MGISVKFAGVLGLLLFVAVVLLYLSSGNSLNLFPSKATSQPSITAATPAAPAVNSPMPSDDSPTKRDYFDLAVIIIILVVLLFAAMLLKRR